MRNKMLVMAFFAAASVTAWQLNKKTDQTRHIAMVTGEDKLHQPMSAEEVADLEAALAVPEEYVSE